MTEELTTLDAVTVAHVTGGINTAVFPAGTPGKIVTFIRPGGLPHRYYDFGRRSFMYPFPTPHAGS